MAGDEVVLALRGVLKDYKSLRPLRVEHFELRHGESVGLLGFDRTAAEVLVGLITGATLPDAGEVDAFGVDTRDITDADEWLAEMDRFGLLSDRIAVLDAFTIEQNLALPFSLDVFDLPDTLREQVRALAAEVGISADQLSRAAATLDAETQLRLRLGKALALGPRVLLAEHPNAALAPESASQFAADLAAVAAERQLAVLIMTADSAFARAACHRVLEVKPATGELTLASGWRRWFSARP
jgi:predicted ABC-type transport system involved in lysophospholipase L1 biosynthesis ATPase subunit